MIPTPIRLDFHRSLRYGALWTGRDAVSFPEQRLMDEPRPHWSLMNYIGNTPHSEIVAILVFFVYLQNSPCCLVLKLEIQKNIYL